MRIQLTKLRKFELEDVLILFNKVYEDYYWPNQHTLNSLTSVYNYMNIDNDLSYIFCENGSPIGLAIIAREDNKAWLYSFGFINKYRGIGLGKKLLSAVLKELKANKIESIGLEVLLQNKYARKLYKGMGFLRQSYLECYSFTDNLHLANQKTYSYEKKDKKEIKELLKDYNDKDVVWSRRYHTLLKRDVKWLVAIYKNKIVAILAYSTNNSLSLYRFIPFDDFHSEKALISLINTAQIENPHCSRKVAVNINHDDIYENKLLTVLGFKRFMRQEYLHLDLAKEISL